MRDDGIQFRREVQVVLDKLRAWNPHDMYIHRLAEQIENLVIDHTDSHSHVGGVPDEPQQMFVDHTEIKGYAGRCAEVWAVAALEATARLMEGDVHSPLSGVRDLNRNAAVADAAVYGTRIADAVLARYMDGLVGR